MLTLTFLKCTDHIGAESLVQCTWAFIRSGLSFLNNDRNLATFDKPVCIG